MVEKLFKWSDGVHGGWVADGEILFAAVRQEPFSNQRSSGHDAQDVSWYVSLAHFKGDTRASGVISGAGISVVQQNKLVKCAKNAAMSALKLLDQIEEDRPQETAV